ncbi:MAG: MiaB/RimO family radical SAM methylthiotransferase [Christensenellaceae bacterium]|jgi:threonylcarbamoyladenosine tRNA methylthiotransferase MtaB|nr:MiaB/RimO family radical SAM methylthiotransferase [Christensenellaceae bacterium]
MQVNIVVSNLVMQGIEKAQAVIFNVGCKSNQYECDKLTSELIKRGYEVFNHMIYADIYIVNTCAVTSTAEAKSRQVVARIRAINANAKIYIFGCASALNQAFYSRARVHYSTSIGYTELLRAIDEDINYMAPASINPTPLSLRTRAYVKIQDGCDNFCSYCIIPSLRGIPTSKPIDVAASEILEVSKTVAEVVIVGINLSLYGRDTHQKLSDLIKKITNINSRIHLSSFYQNGINRELLDALFSLKQFSPHFHLSLQHGDTRVLRAMNRGYTSDDYLKKVELIREYDPNASITTDIIVGYPTEDNDMFVQSCKFVRLVEFADIHIFPFSQRTGTLAAQLPPIASNIIKERRDILKDIRDELHTNYLKKLIAIPQCVIFEKFGEIAEGYSQYYVRTYADTKQKICNIKPVELYNNGLKGVLI